MPCISLDGLGIAVRINKEKNIPLSCQHLLYLCGSEECCSLGRILRLSILPLLGNVCLSCLTSWLEGHLEGVRFDDKKRVGLVQGHFDLPPGDGVDLPFQIESPHQATTAGNSLVTGDRHTETLTLSPTERCHTSDHREFGERSLESRPARLEPPLRSVRLWIWVLNRVAKEGIVERQDAGALGDEVSTVPVISFTLMGNTCRICQLESVTDDR